MRVFRLGAARRRGTNSAGSNTADPATQTRANHRSYGTRPEPRSGKLAKSMAPCPGNGALARRAPDELIACEIPELARRKMGT